MAVLAGLRLKKKADSKKKYWLIYLPFLEMTYRYDVTLDGQYVALDIMDTAGEVSTETQTNKLTNKQINRQTDRYIDRQTDR